MQVYLNTDKSCQVEFRDGSADRHFQATVPGPFAMTGHFAVARVLQDWAFDRPGWREALPWAAWPGEAVVVHDASSGGSSFGGGR